MAVTITITGPVRIIDDSTRKPLSDPKKLSRVAKLKFTKEKISDYFGANMATSEVTGGDIRLAEASGAFTVTSSFKAPRPLSPEELAHLREETIGQWSDGIGESCFDETADRLGIQIDLCPNSSQIVIKIDDDGKPARKKSAKTIANEKLVKAARDGDLQSAKAAIEDGADIDATDPKNKWTALFWCTSYPTQDHTDVALYLIAAGANVSAKGFSQTVLLSEVGNVTGMNAKLSLEVVKALLKAGADPNLTYGRERALTLAKDHPELQEILLAAGAIESNWVLREQGKYP